VFYQIFIIWGRRKNYLTVLYHLFNGKLKLYKKIIEIFVCLLLIATILPVAGTMNEIIDIESKFTASSTANYDKKIFYHNNIQSKVEGDWYYLPSFPNYAPSGLPDFDQRQDDTWKTQLGWTFCGPAALADVLWWFDSKHSDPNGTIGDGNDIFPLVKDYNVLGIPNPGPYYDDHNFNNVNDLLTQWHESKQNGELIERIAGYVNINWYRFPIVSISGTGSISMMWGTSKWIKDAGLQDDFKVETIFRPSFPIINERLRNNEGIVLHLGYYIPGFKLFPIFFGHYVAIAGINSNGYIAVSDPRYDIMNPCSDPTKHNDASIVSHDVYQVNFTSPCPLLSSWWIPKFENRRNVVVISAIIISEKL